ncbi:MAG: DNA polymerase III subunit gamma/tau [Bacilli bacterium]
MYQALYRKYRPKTFDDVVGQDIIIKTMENAIKTNKINHAYLLTGPRGSGKTTVAKILAKMVNCQHLNGTKMCNKCVCCTQTNNQNMDIIEIDAASNNGVDEIREINNKVNLVPSLGKYKIYIIDEVHMLTIGAFNALLKTLEEPPAHVIFILATTDPHKVPLTILSRCQRFDFKKISDIKIEQRLRYIIKEEKINIDDTAVTEIAHLGDGSLRDAISILDQVISYADSTITITDIHDVNGTISQEELKNLILNTVENKLADVIKILDNYSNNGKNIIKIAEETIYFLRNAILCKVAPTYEINNKPIYDNIISFIDYKTMMEYIQILNQTLLDMKKFSDPKMLLELAFIKMMNFSKEIVTGKLILEESQTKTKLNDNQSNTLENKIEIESKQNVDLGLENKGKNISREIEKNKDVLEELNNFIDIRVGNTLANFSKKATNEMKKNLEKIKEYLMDEKHSTYASMLLDGELKATSDEYLVFIYKTQNLSYLFNENITNIEKLLKKVFNKKYKVVAVDLEKWNKIKEKFNSNKNYYVYKEETLKIEEIIKKLITSNDDGIKTLFGELVEYN